MPKKRNEKLRPRFYRPYKIIQVISQVAYKLDLPIKSKSHTNFHVSLLKKVVQEEVTPRHLPPMLSEDMELQVEPLDVKFD